MSVTLPYPDGSHGFFRDYPDAVCYGYFAELELIRRCREKNIFTVSYAFSDDEIRGFTEAGTDVIAVCHGGPFITPENVQIGYKRCPEVAGFVGASSTERLPVEESIVKAIHEMRAQGGDKN